MQETLSKAVIWPFIEGGGEMGDLTRSFNWSQTSLGNPEKWPQSLRTSVSIVLKSKFPMLLWWGDELIQIYNDAYRACLGNEGKHPKALGQPARECWKEILDVINPLVAYVESTRESTWHEDQLIPIYRNGKMEDVYWTYSYTPLMDESGIQAGILITCAETTKKVENIRSLQDTTLEFKNLINEANDSLYRANIYLQNIINKFETALVSLMPIYENNEIVDFRFKMANAAYSNYSNLSPEQIKNKKVLEVFPEYKQTEAFSHYVTTFLTGKPIRWELHYNVDHLNIYLIVTTSKMNEEVIVHFTDITTLKNLQLDLLKKIEELERSNKNLQEFAYAASHDLKEPIRKIRFFSDLLKNSLTDHLKEQEVKYLHKMEIASERMSSLIDDLLNYSQISFKPDAYDNVDLNILINQVLADLELEIEHKKATVKIDELCTVRGQQRQLAQAFQNLISNALKYSKPDQQPEINIKCYKVLGKNTEISLSPKEQIQEFYAIEIIDKGIGFDQSDSEKIFNVFTRLQTNVEFRGTGIGLSIVRKVVENHDGHVIAHSKKGEGSTFKIILPI